MQTLATVTALVAALLNTLAAGVGAWLWWQVEPRRLGWVLVRVGQLAAMALAAAAGVAWISGARPDSGLFWLYAVLPVAIGFFAEQFRLLSAATVLEQRGLPDAHAVGTLEPAEQRSVVLQIARRELGVMVAAAAVIAFLALRAVSEVAGL